MLKLSELKALYDQGPALHYLHPKEKRPIGNDWTQGPRKSWAELKAQFNPAYNIGVRLGEASKLENGYLACIDVDVKDAAYKDIALKKLKEITNGVVYPTVLSGSGNGSRHLYGVTDEPFKMVEIEKHKGKWEICAYSTGRQMVLPPSIHPSGKAYRWKTPCNCRRLPSFDLSRFQRRTNESRPSKNLLFVAQEVDLYESRLSIPTIKMIEDGEGVQDRSADLLSIAMSMCRAGFNDNQILSVLSDENYFISEAARDHTQCNDRARWVQWLDRYTLQKARWETDIMRRFDNKPPMKKLQPELVESIEVEIEEEKKLVLPDINGQGLPKSTLRNLVHILEDFMGGGLVAFNESSARAYFTRDTLYGGVKGHEIANRDDLALKHYVACHYRFEPSKELCIEAHSVVAQKYKYHPIRAYLEGLVWDGKPRLDSWLIDAFSAVGPKDYIAAVGRKVLTAAVTRVFEPGCKFDYVMVLEGNQGKGKSMSLAALASQAWFTDGLGDIKNKDVVDQMTGKWIIELGELASIRGTENEHIKSFFSRQVDRVRLSYERRSEDFPRQSIFIGSTNAKEYFTDETGNRRYWPIQIGDIDRSWVKKHRDQLWAEAYVRYLDEEKLYLDDELETVARKEQEKRYEVDEWEASIKSIIKKTKGPYRSIELWQAIHLTNGQPTRADINRIGKIMHRLGFIRKSQRIDDVVTKCWIKYDKV